MSTQLKAGVIGWPINHSRSPIIHGYWLKKHGISATYETIDIVPDAISAFFQDFSTSGYIGANVTIPYKETVLAFLDRMDESARAIGAVNTIWLDGANLCGTNTDWLGFLGNLDATHPGWDARGKGALVLGAGGAARAILYGLIQRKFERIYVANRGLERALELQAHFGDIITPLALSKADDFVATASLIVNTTSLGMDKNPPLPLDLAKIQPGCLVTDIVYSPLETPLLKQAKARGAPTVDGLGMLLHQAAPGFERWFGVRPQVSDELRTMILRDMGLAK